MHNFWAILLVRWSILRIQPHRKWLRNVGLSRALCGLCNSYIALLSQRISQQLVCISQEFPSSVPHFAVVSFNYNICKCQLWGCYDSGQLFARCVGNGAQGGARESKRVEAGIPTCRGPITKIDRAPPPFCLTVNYRHRDTLLAKKASTERDIVNSVTLHPFEAASCLIWWHLWMNRIGTVSPASHIFQNWWPARFIFLGYGSFSTDIDGK